MRDYIDDAFAIQFFSSFMLLFRVHLVCLFLSGHGDYRTKAHQCLKAIGLLRVVPTTPTSNEQVKFQYKSLSMLSFFCVFQGRQSFDGLCNSYLGLLFCFCCLTQSQQDSPKEEDPTS